LNEALATVVIDSHGLRSPVDADLLHQPALGFFAALMLRPANLG
jgi:hypothetical protein